MVTGAGLLAIHALLLLVEKHQPVTRGVALEGLRVVLEIRVGQLVEHVVAGGNRPHRTQNQQSPPQHVSDSEISKN